MKKILIVLSLFMMLTSCVPLENICTTGCGMQRIDGEVLYAVPARRNTRVVVIKTPCGIKEIFNVPMDQPLTNIPVCEYRGKLYWVMP